jgi:heme exporter protein D
MNWGSASDFFAMGGYGVYVWGSYGVALAAMLADAAAARVRERRALADARREADDDNDDDPEASR